MLRYMPNDCKVKYDYSPLFELLRERKISQYRLTQVMGFSRTQFERMKNGEGVSMETIFELMCLLGICDINMIIMVMIITETGEYISNQPLKKADNGS